MEITKTTIVLLLYWTVARGKNCLICAGHHRHRGSVRALDGISDPFILV